MARIFIIPALTDIENYLDMRLKGDNNPKAIDGQLQADNSPASSQVVEWMTRSLIDRHKLQIQTFYTHESGCTAE